ncbi:MULTISPECIES: S9 family peptidase [unclassified Chelatococcus]|uniref:S9 family peptidase n=1 Tax=unclassified Chelatococcus TaxID=2638111 RepID=UPI001BCA9708|nr:MULTISPECIES: S9 family peptidase [unclassified Chelatococcus]CAH1669333.1 Dipeptidyl aminopeptidase BI [Hyphomicrobiales bacterium]MBS7739348.1 S9 family peptidase [Chelatococcus sp. HY11]MBX3546627.1 S9 family peptidase [Chelatococcus sp.]MCO5076117.1 S9 family peptidase [Chelatococcus sp.]CAH1679218.1 Dipeptidyl aminopeptidase BI [Hyphomicrobiales bacterium]
MKHSQPPTAPPVAPTTPHETVVHGVTLRDDYAWLKADNWREVLADPSALPGHIRAHLEAENAFAETILAPTAAQRKTLVAEMRGRIREDDASVPARDGPFYYYTRYREGGQHPLICRAAASAMESDPTFGVPLADDADILLDGDALAAGKAFFDLAEAVRSPDHNRMAWCADDTGAEFNVIRVRDILSGRDLDDRIEQAADDIVWAADGAAFYYVRLDDNHRPCEVLLHRLGTPAEDDALIFRSNDPAWFVNLSQTQSQRFAVISVSDHETSEAYLLDLHEEAPSPRLVAAREDGLRYEVEHHGGVLFILTNADGAEDFKIVTAPLATPERAQWRDAVPHRPGIYVLAQLVLQRHLVRLERENALPRIVIRTLATGEEHAISIPEEAYRLSLGEVLEFDTDQLRFVYSSMTTPNETYDYDMASHERVLRKRQIIPSGHDPAAYVTRRLLAPAPDGELVPVSILHRRDLKLDGNAPCLLYGYGAYGHALSAGFSANNLSLVDRGFVYAIAHVRGGSEKGWHWYLEGKRDKKPNTFSDFIVVARHLITTGYTASGRIAAHGGSAGGMLMGAIANDAPDLFAAILAEVPFVDVLNTMLDGDLPLTPPEWPEWGNPITDQAAFTRIQAYSPYDQVKAQRYPAILALGGLSDPRVTYWEPAKWIAKVRAKATGGGPFVLRTNMDAGHGGAAGRFDRLDEIALVYAFALGVVQGTLPSASVS